MSVHVKFEAGHIVDHQCTLGKNMCKKMILPRFYQWTEFHPRLFVVKWTEVKAWLPTRFCYGLMHIDLQEWLLKEVRYVEPCLHILSAAWAHLVTGSTQDIWPLKPWCACYLLQHNCKVQPDTQAKWEASENKTFLLTSTWHTRPTWKSSGLRSYNLMVRIHYPSLSTLHIAKPRHAASSRFPVRPAW